MAQQDGPAGGGQPNVAQMMRQAQQMQEKISEAQAELADEQVTGTAGGGLVVATVTGHGDLLSMTIQPEVVNPDDVEMLQDLVVAAVRDAIRAATELARERIGPLTGGLGGALGGVGVPSA